MTAPTLAFCEPVTAVPMGKWHIRIVGSEGRKPGGGIRGAALCGRNLAGGWDLSTLATLANINEAAAPRPGDGHVWACTDCAAAARLLLEGATP